MATEFEEKKQRHASGESSKSGDSVSNYIPTPPDGGYGWVIVLCSFVNHILVDGISFTFGVFYLEFLDYFQESKGRTALVGSLLVGTYLMSGIVASALTNRFGCRPVCIVGGLLSSASFFLASFSTSLNMLMVTYGFMAGFGFGLVYLPSVISVSYYFEKRRALATGIGMCGAGVGCFIFAPVGGALLTMFDWRNALMIISALVLNTCVTGALMRPLPTPKSLRKPREKNAFDRLMERARNKLGIKRSDSVSSDAHHAVAQKVHQMKLNREKLIREEDGESEYGSAPNSTLNSVNKGLEADGIPRSNSLHSHRPRVGSVKIANGEVNIPEIVVEGEMQNGHIEHEEGEGTLMLNTAERKPIYKGPKANRSLMASILQKKLQEAEGHSSNSNGNVVNNSMHNCNEAGQDKKKSFRALESAPNLVTNKVQLPENLIDNQGRYHSDVWSIKQKKRNSYKNKRLDIPKEDYARPMYRKDIFYSGSIRHLPEFQSNPNVTSYVQSMTSIPDTTPPEDESKFWKLCCLPKVSKDVFKTMLDVSLLKDPVFVIVCLGNGFGMLGVYVPFVFLADRSVGLGIEPTKAAFLLSVIGVTNTLGRVLAGFLADLKWVNSLLMHNVAVMALGIASIFNMFCNTYPLMCAFAAVFGLCFATWISVTTIILCNLLGMEKLTNAFGILTMVRGICSVAGPPLAGVVYDATGDFDAAFHTGGGIVILSALCFLILHLPYFRRKKVVDNVNTVVAQEVEEDLLHKATAETA